MELIQGLQQLGLSEYESRAYAALVAQPGATGYEVAKSSGVPRAKIYEALEGLVEKGAALTSQDGDRLLYHPLPHETLVQRYRERAERVAVDVKAALDAVANREPDQPLVTVRGENGMLARAREIIGAARHRVFVSGWPGPVAALEEALKAAEARGVKVYVMVYGELKLGIANLFLHPAPGRDRRIARLPEMFIVVGDHTEVIMGEVGEHAVGLWTRNQAVTLIAAEFIRHDIMLQEWSVRLGAMPADTQDLQAMWFFTREEEQ